MASLSNCTSDRHALPHIHFLDEILDDQLDRSKNALPADRKMDEVRRDMISTVKELRDGVYRRNAPDSGFLVRLVCIHLNLEESFQR